MNALDGTALFIIVIFVGLGIFSGFLRSVSSLVALVAGILIARFASPAVSGFLTRVHLPDMKGILAFILVFFFFFIAVKILFYFLEKLSKSSGLTPVNRACGGFIGLIKGLLIVAVIFTLAQMILPKKAAILTESKMLPHINKIVAVSKAMLPE